jgi:hypothetical protein
MDYVNECETIKCIFKPAIISDFKKLPHVEIACYILAGIMMGVLLLIYYPLCRWYLKADAAIEALTETDVHADNMITSREMSRDHLMENRDEQFINSETTRPDV